MAFNIIVANSNFIDGNYETACKMYYFGAKERNSDAALNLAEMYLRGVYLHKDFEKAMKYYVAASMTDGIAEYNLALMYMRGYGCEKDLKKALDYMQKSALLDNAYAEYYLGFAHSLGRVYDPIEIECVSKIPFPRIRYRSSENLLEGTAEFNEDEEYEAISMDEYESVDYFKKAANHDIDDYESEFVGNAKFILGQAALEGVGNEYDLRKGYRLIAEAARDFDNNAAKIFLAEHSEEARIYGISEDLLKLKATEDPNKLTGETD